MSTIRRRMAFAIGAALVPAVMVAGLAWACTPQAQFTAFSPSSGAPGTVVTLTGEKFADAQPITIRWGSASGPVLGHATGPEFSTAVTVPQAPGDVYAIVAVTIGPSPAQSGQASGAFEIVSATPAKGADTSISSAGARPAAQPSPSAAARPESARTSQTASGAPTSNQRGPTSATVRARETADRTPNAFPQRRPAAQPQAQAPATAEPAGTAAVAPSRSTSAPRSDAGPSRTASKSSGRSSAPAKPATFGAPAATAAPTAQSATGDLWTGFKPAQRAGTQPVAAAPAMGGSSNSFAMIGIALLAVGLAALMGGAAVALVRRRRVRTGVHN